jgi:uncharacterized protein YidB (DUF937 family)
MGLLDGVMGSIGGDGRRPGLGSTVAAGAILALLVKGVRSYQQSHPAAGEGRSFDPGQVAQGQVTEGQVVPGQIPPAQVTPAQAAAAGAGGLGGLLGGAGGLGGLLSGLGGASALGALVGQFQQRGLGPQVSSWIGSGANQPVAPDQVAHALGEENIQALQQQTGTPREALLTELAQHLPDAVHQLTPQGRLPDDDELHQIAQGQAGQGT